MPSNSSPVGSTLHPPRSASKKRPSHAAAVASVVESRPPTAINQAPTDLSNVLHSKPYRDSSEKDITVTPSSHCWTQNSSLYCGCKGGQLFSVDADVGSIQLLINPVSVLNGETEAMPIIPEELNHCNNQGQKLSNGKAPTTSDTLLVLVQLFYCIIYNVCTGG